MLYPRSELDILSMSKSLILYGEIVGKNGTNSSYFIEI
jgi:hypothetical protein